MMMSFSRILRGFRCANVLVRNHSVLELDRRMPSKQSDNVGLWKPSKARYEFRRNPEWQGKTSSGFCMGYLQANLAILPSSLAKDFQRFCELNNAPCPLLYRSKTGELSAGFLAPDSDVRTDLQLYCISKDGNIDTMKSSSLSDYSLDDYVSFYLGCSFSFEEAMIKAGIPLQNVSEKRNVSMFITNIQCKPAGPFSCPMVVSMRPIPRGLVEKAVIVTAAYDAVHGAPIHVGDPSVIGIDDINNTDFGEPSDIGDLIPMFWACGVTSSLAVRSAKPSLCFSHSPGSMFIADISVEEYFKLHKPQHGDEQPRLITLTDQPYLASVCSDSVLMKVEDLAKISADPSNTGSTKDVGVTSEFLKSAVRLSHAPSVVIGFLGGSESSVDYIQGMMALVKALQALNKQITVVMPQNSQQFQDNIEAYASQGQISKDNFRVVKCDRNCDVNEAVFQGEINHRRDTAIVFQLTRTPENADFKDPVDSFFQEVRSKENGIVSIKITEVETIPSVDQAVDSHTLITGSLKVAGCGLAAALYVLNKCPIHSRYVQRGIGKKQVYQVEQFKLHGVEEEVCSRMFQIVTGS